MPNYQSYVSIYEYQYKFFDETYDWEIIVCSFESHVLLRVKRM